MSVLRIGEQLRYGQIADFPADVQRVDGMTNWWAATRSGVPDAPSVKLDAGINAPARTEGLWQRLPFIAIRSSPNKAGSEIAPWEDVHRPDEGYVRYFGDNKANGSLWAHETLGNRRMLDAWRNHVDGDAGTRLLAPPILVFRGFTYRGRQKGQLVFNGVGVIDRAELVVQADPSSGQTFTNYRYDLTLLDLARENDTLDWAWLDARRDGRVSPAEALELAPHSWREWVRKGAPALERLRRHVLRSRIVADDGQKPVPGSEDERILFAIYDFYKGRQHRFEALADFVTGRILEARGVRYDSGWLTTGSGDGGVDFVGRVDLDPTGGFVSSRQVLLGQAKCEAPSRPTNGVHLARLVARLRRGWFGVFVTTSYFSRNVQREVLADRYPLMLVHGARVANEVRQHLIASRTTLDQFLRSVDAEYEQRVGSGDPELVLLD